MILIIITSILFIISLICFIVSLLYYEGYDWKIGLPFICTSILSMILTFMICFAVDGNSSSGVQSKRAELHTRYEILNEAKNNPYAYDKIIEYNEEVKTNQKCLESPWTNWLYCPAYKDAKIIDIE